MSWDGGQKAKFTYKQACWMHQMLWEGHSQEQIAISLDCDNRSIRRTLQRYGFQTKYSPVEMKILKCEV